MLRQSDENLNLPEAQGEASISDIWSASQDITMTLTESQFHRLAREEAAKIGNKLTPEQANERFPGLGADREISEGEAQYLHDWKVERHNKQKIIDTASDSFLKGTVLPFVAGAAKSLTDPAEVAIGLLTGGIGNGLKVGASLGKRLAIDGLEASLSQAIAEAPIMKEYNESLEEYTVEQFAKSAALASMMQIGITYGASAAYKGTAKALGYAGEKTSENLYRLQKSLDAEGVNTSAVMDELIGDLKTGYEDIGILVDSVNRNLPDLDVSKAENFEEVMSSVLEAHKKGGISDEALETFVMDSMDSGVNAQMMKRSVEDSAYEFSDDMVESVKRKANDPSNEIGYTNRFYELTDNIPADVGSIDDEIVRSFNESFDNLPNEILEDSIEVADGKMMSVKKYKELVQTEKESTEFLKSYADCLRGVISE